MLNYFYIVVLPATERSFSLGAALPNEAEGAAGNGHYGQGAGGVLLLAFKNR